MPETTEEKDGGKSATHIHGHDKSGDLFKGGFPQLYAIEGAVVGGYERQSANTAMLLDSYLPFGMKDLSVADIGCAYGTTTKQLARFDPKWIFACDNSPDMIELAHLATSSTVGVAQWLESHDGRKILGEYFDTVVRFISGRRDEFQQGRFAAHRGVAALTLQVAGLMDLKLNLRFSGVVLNNVFHWPVNQLRAQMPGGTLDPVTVGPATATAFARIAKILVKHGVAVLQEPKDFVTCDEPELEEYCEAHTLATHPVFRAVHETLNRLLMERHGITRTVPKSSGMFHLSKMSDWAAEGGLQLEKWVHMEDCDLGDSLEWCAIRLLIWMGAVELPFDEKLKLASDTYEYCAKTLSDTDRYRPMRQQSFYFVLKKQ